MTVEAEVRTTADQRRFARVPFMGAVTYRYEPDFEGAAMCVDVSRGGMCLHLGRYLRPGKHVMLHAVALDGEPVELKGHVTWCHQVEGSHAFATGVRVYHDEPESMSVLSTMVHEGLEQSGVFDDLRALYAERRQEQSPSQVKLCEAHMTIDLGPAIAAGVMTVATAPSA